LRKSFLKEKERVGRKFEIEKVERLTCNLNFESPLPPQKLGYFK
jgi:hypothetical protein